MTDNSIARAYFRYHDARYRVTVTEKNVWIERQTPRAYGGNMPIRMTPDEVLYGTESWIVEALPKAFKEYEGLLDSTE